MKRRALRSKKCKDGFHQGQSRPATRWFDPETGDPVDKDSLDAMPLASTMRGCRWHGCGCYCHPWFQKRTTIEARGLDGRRKKTTFG